MKKWLATIRVELVLYLMLAVAATWLRFANLDWPPLNNVEAAQALAALKETPAASILWTETDSIASTSPAYKILTTPVFLLFGSSDAWARLIPALAGIALVFTPLLLRQRLGSGRALATAFILGFSPTLIAASRTADGTSLAILSIAVAVALMLETDNKVRGIWIAIALGLALASGAEAITALIGLGIAIGVTQLQRLNGEDEVTAKTKKHLIQFLWLAPVVALAIASGIGIHLRGLSVLFDSLADWFQGWVQPSGIHPLTLWAMLPFYEPLMLVLGIGGAVLTWRKQETLGVAAVSWTLAAMVLASIYPARQPSDVVWAVIPLSFLAGDALARLVDQWVETDLGTEIIGLVTMILVAFAFGYLNLAAYSRGFLLQMEGTGMQYLFAGAVVALLVAGVLLFGLGWSWNLAWRGVTVTGVILLFSLSFSVGYNQSLGPNAGSGRELWRPQTSTSGLPLFVDVLDNLSEAQTGRRDYLEMEVSPDITASLVWALRDYRNVRFADPLQEVEAPVVLVPEYGGLSGFTDAYVGQVMTVSERWGWNGPMPPNLISWWMRRDAPVLQERWLLFAIPDSFGLQESTQD